jgi:hypothetical protein
MGKVSYLPAARLNDMFYRGRLRIIRFCSKTNENPKTLFQNLKAKNVKAYFDWIEDNFKDSITADSNFNGYWRVFKRLYVQETGRYINENMRTDILNIRRRSR